MHPQPCASRSGAAIPTTLPTPGAENRSRSPDSHFPLSFQARSTDRSGQPRTPCALPCPARWPAPTPVGQRGGQQQPPLISQPENIFFFLQVSSTLRVSADSRAPHPALAAPAQIAPWAPFTEDTSPGPAGSTGKELPRAPAFLSAPLPAMLFQPRGPRDLPPSRAGSGPPGLLGVDSPAASPPWRSARPRCAGCHGREPGREQQQPRGLGAAAGTRGLQPPSEPPARFQGCSPPGRAVPAAPRAFQARGQRAQHRG